LNNKNDRLITDIILNAFSFTSKSVLSANININLSTKLFCLALGVYEGMLWKKGKDNGQFLERKFVLSVSDFTLKYYKEDVRKKKNVSLSNEVCAPFRNYIFLVKH